MSLPLIVALLVIVAVVIVAVVGTVIDKHAGSDDNTRASGGLR
jgi:hypothetical protein